MSAGEVMAGAEPFSAAGGPHGVLVVHGFTATPQSLRGLAEAFAGAGFTVELPLLPGHGTSLDDMIETRWEDWSSAAELAFTELESRCERIFVAGMSMGGAVAAWLAARHPDVAGLVVVNPAVEPGGDAFVDILRAMLDQGSPVMPAIASDIADPDQKEVAYDGTPVAPLLSFVEAQAVLAPLLADIRCPTLIFTSRNDHVVPPNNSDYLADHVGGPVERVTLERSFHVATLDYERDLIESRAVEFARNLTA